MKGMNAFEYVNARSFQHASQSLTGEENESKLIAGGIDLLTELQARIIEPKRVVNLKSIPGLTKIDSNDRGLTLGPLVTLAAIERHPVIMRDYTALAEAAHSVGSPQIRNVGTIGGNLCQRPRCWYYRDETIKCFKKGGVRCYAAEDEGANKYNAILGGGPSYIVHPSDCATALVALGAVIRYGNGRGKPKEVPAEQFFVLPNERLHFENILGDKEPNEILQEIFIPKPARGTRSAYLKFRERDSFDWAMSAVAAVAQVEDGDRIRDIRVVLGGVAPKPWRSKEAEQVLNGQRFTTGLANQAADAALAPAKPLSKNAYKVPLTKVLLRRAVETVATGKSSVTPVV
jgi:xanthine dehydrogenase YagS FAD-binding subunit